MAKTRLDLNEELTDLLGSQYVYYQPPENVKLHYPCIVYEKNPYDQRYADNKTFLKYRSWDLTYIRAGTSRDDNDEFVDIILDHFASNYVKHGGHFVSDGLIHDTFTIYY